MLQKDEIYNNKTFKYLYPCLIELGRSFTNRLNKFVKAGVFIADMNYYTLNSCLYIVISTKPYKEELTLTQYRTDFQELLYWIKLQDFYETDYCYKEDFHIIVVKLPDYLSSSIDLFMSGEYSKIFTIEQINRYFRTVSLTNKILEKEKNAEIENTRKILTKDRAYTEEYAQKINGEYQTNISPKYFQNVELDKPPILSEEILNY